MRRRRLRSLLDSPVPVAVAVVEADPGVRPLLRAAQRDQDKGGQWQQWQPRLAFIWRNIFLSHSHSYCCLHNCV